MSQGQQSRSFSYDSLSRLTSATNPESGTISYQYDANSNLTAKTDARGVSTSFSYDALNRATFKSYTDTTPAVSYFYDASQPASIPVGFSRGASTGRLTAVTSGVTTNFYGFDALGQLVQSFQRTDGTDYGFSYVYNTAGMMTSETYPSGRVVSQSYDGAGRMASVSGIKGATSTTYASSFSYTAHGAVGSLTLGNGLIESAQFNNRLQPTNISLGSLLSLAYNYGASNNNGNMLSMTITPGTGQTPFVQTFGYDALNRLQSGTETVSATQSWNQTFGYDRYGNRWFDPATSGAVMGPISSQADISASNNRIVKAGYAYDAAGNMTAEPGKSYTFDGENKIVTANVGGSVSTYVYDGDGRRVKKATPQGASVYVYDAAGQMIAEYSDTPATGPGGTQYATADHLGTPRLWTNSSGAVISRHDYLPFGEELFAGLGGRTTAQGYSPSAQTDGQRNQFTLKERDAETNLDYFGARYYGSLVGRFVSVDPAVGKALNPQTWNRYAYALNNPLFYVDPDGADSIGAVYRLGTASFNYFVPSGVTLDYASFLASARAFVFTGLQGGNQPIIRHTEPSSAEGGCIFGCLESFEAVPVGVSIDLSFEYDKEGKLTGANIKTKVDPKAQFIGQSPSTQRTAYSPLPGLGAPAPKFFSVNINTDVLKKLSNEQLQALKNSASNPKNSNPITNAIRQEVLEEQKRREEERRKTEQDKDKKQAPRA